MFQKSFFTLEKNICRSIIEDDKDIYEKLLMNLKNIENNENIIIIKISLWNTSNEKLVLIVINLLNI